MNNIIKCVNIINKLNAGGLILFNEANMHYLCSFSPSEGAVAIFSDGAAYHLVDSRYTEKAKQEAKTTGLEVIEPEGSFCSKLAELAKLHSAKKIIFENETISLSLFEKLKSELGNIELVKLNNLLMLERNIKSEEEILLMKKANSIAEKSYIELLNYIKPGKTEKELAAYFDYLMAKNGSYGLSFDTILLSGNRTSMPHGVPSEKKLDKGDFVLFDFGATYKGYHSDMTRMAVLGSASDEMQEMYSLVLNAQLAGIKALNSGVKCSDVYNSAYEVLESKKMGKYFRHGLGHGLGLEIHEGFNASPKSRDTYETGNVTSIEPGIYIPGKFGIRIEDVCYLSPRGRENISKITKEMIIL